MKDKLLAICRERNDSWAATVEARITQIHDLHAADAVYHRMCSSNFRTKKSIPTFHQTQMNSAKKVKLGGRPQDQEKMDAFLEAVKYLEQNDEEQITVSDSVKCMEDSLIESDQSAYSNKYMKKRLLEHYGDKIIINEINSKPNVVTFRSKAEDVLHDFYQQHKTSFDPGDEKNRLVETAAKLIRDDIKSIELSNSAYPSCEELASEDACIDFLPETLRLLLEKLIIGKA